MRILFLSLLSALLVGIAGEWSRISLHGEERSSRIPVQKSAAVGKWQTPDQPPPKKSSEAWKTTLETRLRWESMDGFTKKSLTSSTDNYLLGRFVLKTSRKFAHGMTARLAIKESRAWGLDSPNTFFFNKTQGLVSHPYQDVAELEETGLIFPVTLFGSVCGELNAGRQKISMGNGRVFGPGEFGNTGRYIWDALHLTLKTRKASHILFYGRNKAHHPERFSLSHRHQFEGAGLYTTVPLQKGWILEPFVVGKWDRRSNFTNEAGNAGDLAQYYGGMRLCHLPKDGYLVDTTWVREWGCYAGDGVDAEGYLGRLGYRWGNAVLQPECSVEYSFASGDEDPRDGSVNNFDGVFGGIDQSFGRLGFSTWSNLRDIQFNLSWNAGKARIILEQHRLALASEKDGWQLNVSKYRDKTGSSGTDIGRVFNLLLIGTIGSDYQCTLGSAFFTPGDFAARITNRPQNARWVYFEVCKKIPLL